MSKLDVHREWVGGLTIIASRTVLVTANFETNPKGDPEVGRLCWVVRDRDRVEIGHFDFWDDAESFALTYAQQQPEAQTRTRRRRSSAQGIVGCRTAPTTP